MMKSLEFWQGFSQRSLWCAGLSFCSSQTKTTQWDASQFGSLRAAGWMKRACVRSAQTDSTLCYHKDSIRSFLCTACVREKLLVAITGQHLDTGGKRDGGLGNLQGHERVSCPLITEQETRKHTVLFLLLGFLKVSRPGRRAAHTQDTSPLLREKHAGSDTQTATQTSCISPPTGQPPVACMQTRIWHCLGALNSKKRKDANGVCWHCATHLYLLIISADTYTNEECDKAIQ